MANKTITAIVSAASLVEFISAYPFNVDVLGDADSPSVLVSNLEENYQLDFAPFRVNEQKTDFQEFLATFSNGDDSILEDWRMHTERWPLMVAGEE